EANVCRFQMAFSPPHSLVNPTKGRASIAADESCCVAAVRVVAATLTQQHAHQRLCSRQKNTFFIGTEVVFQAIALGMWDGRHDDSSFITHGRPVLAHVYCVIWP